MEMDDVRITLDELASETQWLRRLATSLVRDAAAAEDLVQDAYVVAAERAPSDGRPIRPWLVRVVVNLGRMRRRSAQRRGTREAAIAALASEPATPDELVGRVELQRVLAGLVLGLATPARDVVLLAYVEGLSSSEIGRRLGIAAGTVRWRLKRALDELRARLDERAPDRAWLATLSAFAAAPRRAVTAAVKWLIAAAIAMVMVAAWIVVELHRAQDDAQPTSAAWQARHAAALAGRAAEGDGLDADGAQADRPTLEPALPPGQRRVSGRVLDEEHRPVSDAEVSLACGLPGYGLEDRARERARTTAAGAFSFVVDASCEAGVLAHKDARSASDFDARDGERLVLVLVLVPDVIATIHVVDDVTGAPIAGAAIRAAGNREELARSAAATDATGDARFALLAPPSAVSAGMHLGTKLVARAAGYAPATSEITTVGELRQVPLERTIRLVPGLAISGQVIGPDGQPEANPAITVYGPRGQWPHFGATERGDAAGRFEIRVPRAGSYGLAPSRTELGPPDPMEMTMIRVGDGGRTGVTLQRVARATMGAEGVVVDGQGVPVAGARVTSPSPWVAPVTTDARGRFAVHARRGPLQLVARAGDQASEYATIDVRPDRLEQLTLTLGPAGITGVVVDPQGLPIAHAQLWVNAGSVPFPGGGIGQRYFTDAHGGFALDVPRGAFRISVRRGFDDDFLDEDDVVLTGGTRDARIVLP